MREAARDRRRRARARDARRAARHERIRNRGRAPARVPPQRRRCRRYQPIVGGGANGCILHYRENNAALRDGDLLLIDAGCEYECYASDITRTFPVNGRLFAEQRALYDSRARGAAAAIDAVRPGQPLERPHEAAVRVITQGLVKLGLLEGQLSSEPRRTRTGNFYMHAPGTGSAWTCTTSATTRSATSGACSSPAWS